MGGWEEEVFVSLLELAKVLERQDAPVPEVRSAYLDAWQYRPTRAEPLSHLARYHRERGWDALADLFERRKKQMKPSKDILFVETK